MAKKVAGARRKKVIKNPITTSLDSKHFINRDLSWLEFNYRVLHEAIDDRVPLLERIRFLGIYSTNLDEFFMKRVGELKRKIEFNPNFTTHDGLTLEEQFTKIRERVLELSKIQNQTFGDNLLKDLHKNNIVLCQWKDLTKEEVKHASQFFKENLFPILTPLAVDPSHPFPFISNLSDSLGICLKRPAHEDKLFARVKIPKVIPQWILLYDNREFKSFRFISVIDIISHHLADLFPGMDILSSVPFRLTRNADWDADDDKDDLVEMIEAGLKERKFAECVRLQYKKVAADPENNQDWIVNFLKDVLELKNEDCYEEDHFLDFTDLKILIDLDLPQLKYKPWVPVTPGFVHEDGNSFLAEIRKNDLLVHHPYESFPATVERFIRIAANDPNVLAIKMTLYRTGDQSLFVKSLIKAAENGKQVVCLVELKARFDEERNIYWAGELEKAGVHVVYGVVGLKTHTKTALVIRKEADNSLCSYAHIGTGNYNSQTSNLYTDLGLFTCNKKICDELVELFHYLTGLSLKNNYEALLIAPINMKNRFIDMIKREIEHVKKGREGLIVAKMNSLEDPGMTELLYEASQAGVKIVLIVRGFCCLRPKIKGISENIEVLSVIGRFLEHSRLFYFRNGEVKPSNGEFYLGSADWMYRNLHNRVEVITPVWADNLKEKCWNFLETVMNDHRQAWELQESGQYLQRKPKDGTQTGSHENLMKYATDSLTYPLLNHGD